MWIEMAQCGSRISISKPSGGHRAGRLGLAFFFLQCFLALSGAIGAQDSKLYLVVITPPSKTIPQAGL